VLRTIVIGFPTEVNYPNQQPEEKHYENRSDSDRDIAAEPGCQILKLPGDFVETHLREDKARMNADSEPERRCSEGRMGENQSKDPERKEATQHSPRIREPPKGVR